MLRIAVIIMVAMLVFAGVYSFMSIFAPKLIAGSGFEASTGTTLDSIRDDAYLKSYLYANRTSGIFALGTTIAGFFIIFTGFRKKEQWAWWAVLIVGGLVWIWGLVNGLIVGDTFNSIMYLVGTVLVIVGLLVPVKIFFTKKSE